MKTICVIPAYNESESLGKVISDVKPYVDEIVVVNDGSSDNTAEVSSANGAIVLTHLINRGQGAALQTGDEYALSQGADIIIHFDADGQFLANEIPDLIKPIINDGYDIVLGSRFLGKEANMPKLKRYLLVPLARLTNYLLLGVKLSDPQSGFRVMTGKTAAMIKIEQSGWAHCSEILAKIFSNKLKFKEVPITVVYTKFGRNFNSGLNIIKDLLIGKFIK